MLTYILKNVKHVLSITIIVEKYLMYFNGCIRLSYIYNDGQLNAEISLELGCNSCFVLKLAFKLQIEFFQFSFLKARLYSFKLRTINFKMRKSIHNFLMN